MHRKTSYQVLEGMSWENVRASCSGNMKMPLSVHAPLNPPFSRKLVYCDCAMNAYVMEVPTLDSRSKQDRLVRNLQRLKMLSFAFGPSPFVPEPAQVVMSRNGSGGPVISAELAFRNMRYINEYCVSPDGLLQVRCSVINEYYETRRADIWCRLAFPMESEVFDYHYVPFEWNASRWPTQNPVGFEGNEFIASTGIVGQVKPGEFEPKWIDEADFSDDDCNRDRSNASPYFIHPKMQLKQLTSTLQMSAEIAPGETRSFEMSFDTACVNKAHTEPISLSFSEAAEACERKRQEIFAGKGEIFAGCEQENAAINAIALCNLQLLIDDGDEFLRPCQGGSSERFYMWVWEAMEALRPMLRLGFSEAVKPVVKFIFSLQDGNCPPEGNFTSLKGAVGTTGQKWACTTGSALVLAAEYVQYSGDRQFLVEYLPKMIAAGRWIINEIRASRIPDSPYYGIMPECRATDGDVGRILVMTDSWLMAGLKKLRDLLKVENHPDAAEFDDECAAYKRDFDAALDRVTQPNGFIESCIGDSSRKAFHFRNLVTAMKCYYAGISSISEPRILNLLRYQEKNVFSGLFCSALAHNCYYVGNSELTAMKAYLELGEWKKAWAASMMFRRCTMTPDLFLTQERYSAIDISFTPWQPNASNNGRYLDLQLTRLWFETPQGIILLGGYAPFELERGGRVGFKRVQTCFGLTELHYENGLCTLKCEHPVPAGTRFVFQEMEYLCPEKNTKLSIKIK